MNSHDFVSDWKFIDELKKPLFLEVFLDRSRAQPGEIDFSQGVSLGFDFSDPDKVLDTAYDDFRTFLTAANIPHGSEGYPVLTQRATTPCFEAFKISIAPEGCAIEAADTEGIRRGLVYLEDEILRSGGAYLFPQIIERKPWVKTRISRCFFGPIKRPPMNRDELIDDVDYYPDEYLNRLAHEGVNALWLTVSFKDLCRSEMFPESGSDCEQRFEKLRKTVKECACYGIKIYIFVIEPWGFGNNLENHQAPLSVLEHYPELAGHHRGAGAISFCVSSPLGRQYVEDCTFQIFSNVPDLGGLIDINMGERPTHCYSRVRDFFSNNCPRCAKKKPWEVVNETVSALLRGIRKAKSDAELISWMYVPQFDDANGVSLESTLHELKEIAAHFPADATFQYNFESMGQVEQLGKTRMVLDYFLSWPGPSEIFSDCATRALKQPARVSAKIQVGCSHELATVPFVPVPGILYKKYKAMHALGVSSVMQCWHFGNYPGLMNKAAGELSFAPFPESEEAFLEKLARTDWGVDATEVMAAWRCFQDSYSNFPVNLGFTHYGPLHHSIIWPLHVFPVDQPISPSWKFTFPLECGDRIGECMCYDHTLPEILMLLDHMVEGWAKGVSILEGLKKKYTHQQARLLDIALVEAIHLQIASARNVFIFYSLREALPFDEMEQRKQSLAKMIRIMQEEITHSKHMIELCQLDSRLGFHSDAEGYKYDPDQLTTRIQQLQRALAETIPSLGECIDRGGDVFSTYSGVDPQGPCYAVSQNSDRESWEPFENTKYRWSAQCVDQVLSISVEGDFSDEDEVAIDVEPCRLWPTQKFSASEVRGKNQRNFKVQMDTSWRVEMTPTRFTFYIPLSLFDGYYRSGGPLRVNVHVNENSWIERHPQKYRLRLSRDNPADLGWLIL